jgi:hypothetical protein
MVDREIFEYEIVNCAQCISSPLALVYAFSIMEILVSREKNMKDQVRKKFAPSESTMMNSLTIGLVTSPAASLIGASFGIPGIAVVGAVMGLGVYGIGRIKKEITSRVPNAKAVMDNIRRYELRMPKRMWDIREDKIVKDFKEEYHAISHVWHKNSGVITKYNLEWNPCNITEEQLKDTREFLLAQGIRYAWVDNLCIDQRDEEGKEEKEREIKDMHIFYTKAKSTIIFPHGLGCFLHEVDDNLNPGKWFERVWTLQELMKSKKPMFAVLRDDKRCLIPAHCMRNILYKAIESDVDLSKERCLNAFIDINRHGIQNITLEDALYAAFKRTVTKEEDRVYGILGFMNKENKFDVKVDMGLGYALDELLCKTGTEDFIAALSTITTGRLDHDHVCYRYRLFDSYTKRACNLEIYNGNLVCKMAKICILEKTSVIYDVSENKKLSPKDIKKILSRYMVDDKYSSAIGEYGSMICDCNKCQGVNRLGEAVVASSINVDYKQYTRLDLDFAENLFLVRIYKSSEGFAPSIGRIYTCIVCEKQDDLYVKRGIAYVDSTFMKWTKQDITIGGVFDIN